LFPISFQTLLEIVGQLFTKECDVRLRRYHFQNEIFEMGRAMTFIIHGGNRDSSSSSSLSGFLSRFCELLVFFFEDLLESLQLLQRGTSPCMISCSMILPATRIRHSKQEAVANDP